MSDAVEPLRRWWVPFAKEIVDYQSLYPELREQMLEGERVEPTGLLKLIEELDDLVFAAKEIPLTGEKRLDPTELNAVVAQVPSLLFRDIEEPAALQGLVDQLNDLMRNAKAVPFTDQVRIDGERVFDLLDQMRIELGRARKRQAES